MQLELAPPAATPLHTVVAIPAAPAFGKPTRYVVARRTATNGLLAVGESLSEKLALAECARLERAC